VAFRLGTGRRIFRARMLTFRSPRRLTRAERVRVSLTDVGGGLRLPLASRRTWIPGLGLLLAFLVVAGIAWQQSSSWRTPRFDTLAHGARNALGVLWLVGLWGGAVVLLVLAAVLLFYRESARLAEDRLIHVARLGPAHVVMEYELARVKNLRAADAGQGRAQVRFDYDDGEQGLGSDMPPAAAAARVKVIQAAIDSMATRRPSGVARQAEPKA
jgi:hypothetical protein